MLDIYLYICSHKKINPMKKSVLFVIAIFIGFSVLSQTNYHITNQAAELVILGNYNPSAYAPTITLNNPDSILYGIINDVSKDSLLNYLEHLDSFQNRNTGSDTSSNTKGIGAVRRWIFKKFEEISTLNENRLLVSYLEFDANVCGMGRHRNICAILPGMDTTKKEILFVEAHLDSRCESSCDTNCYAPGMEDNGSGTVLVIELARIMSKYAFDHTIVFSANTGEEQGLWGAKAWLKYFNDYNVPVLVCFNNDMVSGIICGQIVSPPACPVPGGRDSTNVRIFSYSFLNDSSRISPHKQLARYIKLQQEERINPLINTPMNINMMILEDRVGRGGDHKPFRYMTAAVRIISQNENGDGSGSAAGTQHTSTDIIGYDTSIPPDGIIDSFLVDMSYLRRNVIMNGVNLGFLAISPKVPDPTYTILPNGVEINMQGEDTVFKHYRVGIRSKGSGTLYFDTVYRFQNTTQFQINNLIQGKDYYFSVTNVKNSVESLFTDEYTINSLGIKNIKTVWGIELKQNYPNPVTDNTSFTIIIKNPIDFKQANLVIKDILSREIYNKQIELNPGVNKTAVQLPPGLCGVYTYSLVLDGITVQTKKMVVY